MMLCKSNYDTVHLKLYAVCQLHLNKIVKKKKEKQFKKKKYHTSMFKDVIWATKNIKGKGGVV